MKFSSDSLQICYIDSLYHTHHSQCIASRKSCSLMPAFVLTPQPTKTSLFGHCSFKIVFYLQNPVLSRCQLHLNRETNMSRRIRGGHTPSCHLKTPRQARSPPGMSWKSQVGYVMWNIPNQRVYRVFHQGFFCIPFVNKSSFIKNL